MARRMFTLSELVNLDLGKIDAAFRQEMKRAVADICDRPEDDSARTVTLKMELRAEELLQGQVERVAAVFSLDLKIPKRQSRAYSMSVQANNQLLFNAESPDDPHQMTIDEIAKPGDGPAE